MVRHVAQLQVKGLAVYIAIKGHFKYGLLEPFDSSLGVAIRLPVMMQRYVGADSPTLQKCFEWPPSKLGSTFRPETHGYAQALEEVPEVTVSGGGSGVTSTGHHHGSSRKLVDDD